MLARSSIQTEDLRGARAMRESTPLAREPARGNGGLREVAAAAMATLTPPRFAAAQRQNVQRQGGFAAIAAAHRMQGTRSNLN